jgi:hypothetical protein
MQLCAAFNIHDASTTMIFYVEAVRCIVARNGESKRKSRFNAQSLEEPHALCKWCHAEAILPPRRVRPSVDGLRMTDGSNWSRG